MFNRMTIVGRLDLWRFMKIQEVHFWKHQKLAWNLRIVVSERISSSKNASETANRKHNVYWSPRVRQHNLATTIPLFTREVCDGCGWCLYQAPRLLGEFWLLVWDADQGAIPDWRDIVFEGVRRRGSFYINNISLSLCIFRGLSCFFGLEALVFLLLFVKLSRRQCQVADTQLLRIEKGQLKELLGYSKILFISPSQLKLRKLITFGNMHPVQFCASILIPISNHFAWQPCTVPAP